MRGRDCAWRVSVDLFLCGALPVIKAKLVPMGSVALP